MVADVHQNTMYNRRLQLYKSGWLRKRNAPGDQEWIAEVRRLSTRNAGKASSKTTTSKRSLLTRRMRYGGNDNNLLRRWKKSQQGYYGPVRSTSILASCDCFAYALSKGTHCAERPEETVFFKTNCLISDESIEAYYGFCDSNSKLHEHSLPYVAHKPCDVPVRVADIPSANILPHLPSHMGMHRCSHVVRGTLGSAPSCLHLARRSPRLLLRNVILRIDLEEVVKNDQEHGCASEEDGECVELVVGNHLGRAFVM